MESLKRIIGPAPSEMTVDELTAKVRKRQEFVGNLLRLFREQSLSLPPKVAKERKPTRKASSAALGDLLRELKEAGVSLEEFKKIARGREE